MHLKEFGAIGIAIFLWGSGFVVIRDVAAFYPPGHLALLRFLVASVVFGVIAFFRKPAIPRIVDVPGIALLGIVGLGVTNFALNAGERTVDAGTTSLILNLDPIFTVLFAWVFLHERITARGWIGVLLGFLGATIIVGSRATEVRLSDGVALIVFVAIASGAYTVLQKGYLSRYGALDLVSYIVWSGTVFFTIFSAGFWSTVAFAPARATIEVIYLGIFPGALAYTAWAFGLSKLSASVTIVFMYLLPLTTIIISWFWLGELPGFFSLGGGLLIIVGVTVTALADRAAPPNRRT
jgi:drug/metabolite transporter (DMT)-like permease